MAAETMSFAHKVKHQLRNNGSISPSCKQPRILSHNSGGGPLQEHPQMHEIVSDINRGLRVMVCMRGAPGSGKSYLAQTVVDRTMDGDYDNHIFSTDDFFYDKRTKQYNYNRQLLSRAHDSNQFRVAQRALNGWSPIIVDNTNMKLWEMMAYVKEGIKNGYVIHILEPNTPWCKSVSKMAMKNKHGVEKETIARMLDSYEPGTLADLLRMMNLKPILNPQLRHFPEIRAEPEPAPMIVPRTSADLMPNSITNPTNSPPKEQRFPKRKEINDSRPATAIEPDTKLNNWNDIEWPAYEDEQQQFWNSDAVTKPANLLNAVPKPQRSETNQNNIFDLLREASQEGKRIEKSADETLTKHEKNCPNENRSFQQIRHIYPYVPVSLLWDLFEKCNGDGDWTMDILLNEDFTNGIQKLHSEEEIGRDNFACSCRSPPCLELQEAANAIPAHFLQDIEKPVVNRLPRRIERIINDSDSNVRKQIEEQFIIGDEHYSERMRKVRDFRRGILTVPAEELKVDTTLPPTEPLTVNDMSPIDDLGDGGDGADEMIEIDLGLQLVCQLDSSFGTNAIQSDNLKNIKTNVFMPRSLGQQLYAIWVESLYHQIEEQRKETLKEDEQFARELQEKQLYSQSFPNKVNENNNNELRDIVDMQYTWTALKADESEWKQTSPEDLATKLTKAKLFEIFPNIKKETLVEVFAAHDNKFATTVETLKDSLDFEIGEKIHVESQKLVNQAQEEVEAVRSSPSCSTHEKISLSFFFLLQNFQIKSSQRHPVPVPKKYDKNLNKMDIEEAKRAALQDFEDNRNMAMHHSHLKAECYSKAKEAFQRRQHGVAYYYSNVANLHNSKIDMYNNKAANAIVEVHSYSQQNQDMLDLHYLHVAEAVECLDIFLDKHIKQLKDLTKGFKYVFIITGRGLHSTNGFSTIKQRVKGRFRERNLS